ncbi:MAG: response regulator [Chitinivibrionales bacterium]|nr:response regulator [Chitinivibrionales bacterium]
MEPKKKIVLIDDDEDFIASVAELLEAFDYEVFSAFNGSDGLALAVNERPDLIILDVMMTYETEGFDIARKIRTKPELKSTKVLLVSGIVSEKRLPSLLKPDVQWLPVERILEKPIEPSKLIGEVEKLLDE